MPETEPMQPDQQPETTHCDGCGNPTPTESLQTVQWPELGGLEPMKFRSCPPCTKRAASNGASILTKETP